jgi:hypothetical protein
MPMRISTVNAGRCSRQRGSAVPLREQSILVRTSHVPCGLRPRELTRPIETAPSTHPTQIRICKEAFDCSGNALGIFRIDQ